AQSFRHARPIPNGLLLDLDALGVDEFRPVLDLILELDLQRRAKGEGRIGIDLGEPFAHDRIRHGVLDGLFESGPDRLRRALRYEQTHQNSRETSACLTPRSPRSVGT